MDSARLKLTLHFEHPVTAYALVIGGYFPLSLAFKDVLLIDRNILSALHTVSGQGYRQDAKINQWWLGQLDRPDCRLNPALCAMESAYRSTPDFEQFRESFNEACDLIRRHLPKAQIVFFEEGSYEAAYEIVKATAPRYENERNFLIAASPLLATPTAQSRLRDTEDRLFSLCDRFEVEEFSLPFIAALSCLYEDRTGKELLVGRKLIKPSVNYGEMQAHNALSDFRSLECLALASGIGLGNLTLCTRDRALAAFWCALKFEPGKWNGGVANIKLKVGEQLFPALSTEEVNRLYHRMEVRAYSN